MKIFNGILTLLFFCIFSSASLAVSVGVTTLSLKDSNRLAWSGKELRPLTTHIFYPTNDEKVTSIKLGEPGKELFIAGAASWDAKRIEQEKLPLIIMSHGTGGSALQMLWLAEPLVKSGYLVVGVNHHGNTAIEPKSYAEGFMLWWERSKDVAEVLNQLNDNEVWAPYFNPSQVGIVGFSLGGYTAISAIGGITDRSLFAKFCASDQRDTTCDAQLEFSNIEEEFNKVKDTNLVKASLARQHDSYTIDQIKAAFLVAPANAQSFTENSLRQINVPVAVVVGTNDKVTPSASNARRIASLVRDTDYSEIEEAGHYTFLSECTAAGKQYLTELCRDSPQANRSETHGQVGKKVVSFFNSIFQHNH